MASRPQQLQAFAGQPEGDGTYIMVTNISPGQTWIVLPMGGNLWVAYERGDSTSSTVYIWHQGGSTTPVSLGFNTYQVNGGDALVYNLSDPANTTIKLGWAYQ